MSRLVKVGMGALAAVAMSAHLSVAADLDPPAPVIEHKPISVGGGFYLRGDIGYSIWQDPDISDTVGGGVSQNFGESADNSLLAGVGIGYDFGKYFRADVTFDLRKGKDVQAFAPCGACLLAGGPGFTTSNFSQSAYVVLANAYVDLGEFKGFTPYVGGGVGGAFIDNSTLVSSGNPAPQDPVAAFSGDDEFRFAWALHAGTEYAVNDNLSFDLSYRYLNISDGRIADIAVGGQDFGDVDDDGLDGHEIRVGFRYTFGGGKKHYNGNNVFK